MIKVYIQKNSQTSSDFFLKECLAKFLELNTKQIELDKHPTGQPFMPNRRVSFSLTHSEHLMACACSLSEDVGLDLQLHRSFNPQLFERICTPTELASLPARSAENFFDVWTIKEAALKSIGTGLAYPMDKLEIDFRKKRIAVLEPKSVRNMLFHGSRSELDFSKLQIFEGATAHIVWSQQSQQTGNPEIEIIRLPNV